MRLENGAREVELFRMERLRRSMGRTPSELELDLSALEANGELELNAELVPEPDEERLKGAAGLNRIEREEELLTLPLETARRAARMLERGADTRSQRLGSVAPVYLDQRARELSLEGADLSHEPTAAVRDLSEATLLSILRELMERGERRQQLTKHKLSERCASPLTLEEPSMELKPVAEKAHSARERAPFGRPLEMQMAEDGQEGL